MQRSVGSRVNEARLQREWSLRQLAARAGLSASMLCMIEKGTTNPSVASLLAIAGALGLPLSHFFDEAGLTEGSANTSAVSADAVEPPPAWEDRSPVLRSADRQRIELTDGIRWERLTPGPEGGMEFLEVVYEVGASSGEQLYTHGGREWGMVLEGELVVQLGFDEHVLSPGDTIIFDSTTPHRLSNRGTIPVRAVWLNYSR